MKYFVTIGGQEIEVELGADGVRVAGEEVSADLVEMDGTDVHSLLLGAASYRVLASRSGTEEWHLHLSGHKLQARIVDERTRAIEAMTGVPEGALGPKSLRAPMPGLVVKVEVLEGDEVSPGQGLVIVEAMKMENELKSDGEGRIKKILVEPGQAVEKDQVLIEFELPVSAPEEGSEE